LVDDLIIIPLCLTLIIRLTPPEIMEAAKVRAEQSSIKPVSYVAGIIIVCIWISIAAFFALKFYD
jgi:Ca2+/H+ antiporter